MPVNLQKGQKIDLTKNKNFLQNKNKNKKQKQKKNKTKKPFNCIS